ncbi:MAG: 3-phenylpropionate/cinnamic acid dioxygenase subunit beta [Candidatus Binatia bacterium]
MHDEILDFLVEEAHLLDLARLDEWLELMTEDISYTMPVRQTVYRNDGPGFDPGMCHFDEDMASLRLRVRRLIHTASAFSEEPPSRVRRSVTNVRVHETSAEGEYAVASHLLVLRNRWDLPTYDVLSAARHDVLRRAPDGLRLARRRILVDQATLGTANLSIFL